MPDTITVEIIRAALNAAAQRMRITLIKTAYNHIISESLDFGCAIFDPDVQMIAQGIGLPVFQGHLGFPIQATIADRGIEAFREGDQFFREVLAKYGREAVLEATQVYMAQSEQRTRAALARIPAGVYRAVGHFDNDGISLDRPVRVEMAITVGDGGMTVDFAGS